MQSMAGKRKTAGLHIIVVGCGKVGYTLVEELVREGHDLTVVDIQEQVISDVTDSFDVMGIVGNGGSLQVLQDAGLGEADVLIAVTGQDELNLLCCTLAKKVGSSLAAIARVRNPDYSEELNYLRKQLGLAMIINPDMEAAREVSRIISRPRALGVTAFAKGHAELVRFVIPEGNVLHGKRVKDLDHIFAFEFLVCAVLRGGEVHIPSGAFVLSAGDDISILSKAKDVHSIFESIGLGGPAAKSCMIVGGGHSSYYLARRLVNQRMDVKIIEKNRDRCKWLMTALPKALVVNGDGSDERVLLEEGIETRDAFCALTGIDEQNIMLSLYAGRIPGIKTITKINRIGFTHVVDALGLGSVVYPKHIVAEAIMAYVRARANTVGSNVETLYHLFENQVEAVEFHIRADAPLLGIPLMQMKLKDNLLVACINRGGKVFFPRGMDVLEPEDTVVIVTKHTGFSDVSDILR